MSERADEIAEWSGAGFDLRAIAVCEHVGFGRTHTFDHATNGRVFSFVEMERPA